MDRLLKPGAFLARRRPVGLTALGRRLRAAHRTGLALQLLAEFFPEQVTGRYRNLAGQSWWQLLHHLVSLVEGERWFEIDWESLNLAWAAWEEEPAEAGRQLALWLQYVPVRLHGFSPGDSLFEYPPLELMRALFDPELTTVSSNVLIEAELWDNLAGWGAADRARAWERLNELEADPGLYPEPARWLPELVRWACGRTGNFLLDRFSRHPGLWLSWRDAPEIRIAYRRAQPALAQLTRLMAWYEADPARLALLARCLTEGVNHDHLDW